MIDVASLLKGLPLPLFTTSAEGRVDFCNDAALALFGSEPRGDDAVGPSLPRLRALDGDKPVSLAVSEAVGGDRYVLLELSDGSRKLVILRMTPIKDSSGAFLGALYLIVDVEKRKSDEVAAASLAAIVNGSDDAIISKTLDGIVTCWNAGAMRLFGFTADEMMGESITRIIPPELRQEEERILARVRRGQRVEPFDTVRIARDGRRVPISLSVSPLRDNRGNLVGASKVARDIADRIRAQEEVAATAERFRLLARATHDVIRDWDLGTGALWWSEGVTSVLGYTPEAIGDGVGGWKARIHPEDRERVIEGVDALIRGRASEWRDEYRFLKADGSWAIVMDRGFVVRDADGTAVRLIASMRDVTERRELDSRLRQSQKLEAVGQLTGGIAHDFNNLLTVILGNAEELSHRVAHDRRLRPIAEMIETAAERAAELTNRLLAFARRQPLEPRALDINELVSGLESLLRRTLGEDIEIENVRGGGLWRAAIDPNQLENAVLNLALNARDAMPDGGRLIIETANAALDEDYARRHEEVEPGQYVMLAISDTGCGMDAEAVQRAFEPFFSTKDVGRGSGLGLSMVYGFVKQSLGHVKIYSELGHGTTVKLYLPRAAGEPEHPSAREVEAEASIGLEKILVVEDDPLVRNHVGAQLETLGYHVVIARNAAEALDLLRRAPDFDLLFTDVVMPGGMNGRQLAEEVRRLLPEMPVLFTSGYTENAIVHQGRLDRGVHLLSKPYRRAQLASKVRAVIDETKARR